MAIRVSKYNPIEDHLDDLPPMLYKYRTFDDDDYAIAMAAKGEVFFSSARHFNDPFENYFIPRTKLLELPNDQLKNELIRKAERDFPSRSRLEQRALVLKAFSRFKKIRNNPAHGAGELLEMQYRKFGILSLVKEPFSLPMWAYYANEHRGMWIGLRTEAIAHCQKKVLHNKGLMVLHDVNYVSDLPKINIDTEDVSNNEFSNISEIEPVHCTKSKQWEHEQEIRLIYWNKPDYKYTFGTDAIAEVIVGMRADDKDIEKLQIAMDEADSDAKLRRAKKANLRYGIEFEELT